MVTQTGGLSAGGWGSDGALLVVERVPAGRNRYHDRLGSGAHGHGSSVTLTNHLIDLTAQCDELLSFTAFRTGSIVSMTMDLRCGTTLISRSSHTSWNKDVR